MGFNSGFKGLKEFQEIVLFFKFVIDVMVGHCDGLLRALKIVVVARVVSLSISGSGKNSG
jgi:hypothetical protein